MTEKKASIPRHWLAKPGTQAILFVLTVAYVISPIDVIPDVIPVIGLLDDLGVIVAQVLSFLFYLKQRRQDFEARRNTNSSSNEGKS